MPRAMLLTLTSSSTLDRSCYLRSRISSGYIAIRLERHQGHGARSPAAHLVEFVNSARSRPCRLRSQSNSCKSYDGRQQLKWASSTQLFTLTSSSHQSTWTSSCQRLILTSSSHQFTWTSSTQLFTLTSSSHQSTWTSSCQQFLLTSSSP